MVPEIIQVVTQFYSPKFCDYIQTGDRTKYWPFIIQDFIS